MPNPTDTARALVEEFESKIEDLNYATMSSAEWSRARAEEAANTARAALLAHVDTLRIERDGFKELYEEWLTWAKGAVEKCKPEIPPSDSPQAQGIIDERLAHVAGVDEKLATLEAWLRDGHDENLSDRWICTPNGSAGPVVARGYEVEDIERPNLSLLADALEAASVGDNPFRAYCRLAAIKYLWRAGKKADAIEDAKKAIWYIERYIAHLKETP